jgi:hypothetical protein
MQPSAEQWVALARGCGPIGQFGQFIPVHRYFRPALPPADAIDGSMHGHPAQPIENMRLGGKLAKLGVQFQENVLGRFFSHRAIAEDAESNAENHALVFQHKVAETLLVVFCSEYQVVTWRIRSLPLHSLIRMLFAGGMQKERIAAADV